MVGVLITASIAFGLPWMINWVRHGSESVLGRSRVVISLAIWSVAIFVGYAFMSRQWLKYIRQQTLSETANFLAKAQEFDHVASGAMTLVQEVELVSRGYRMSV